MEILDIFGRLRYNCIINKSASVQVDARFGLSWARVHGEF